LYTVPTTIRKTSIGFVPPNPDVPDSTVTMTYSYTGDNQTGLVASFGSLAVDDVRLLGVPFFELHARLVVTTFNELFIGDLAFLVMLIGMDKSSGAHCLMCMFKGSEFNCPMHTELPVCTKEALDECLEQYMLLSSHPTRKGPPNYKEE
jgi:uncharacterized protein YbbC (DUF1343 family)